MTYIPTQPDILFIMAVMAMIFAVFRYFKDPQIKTEKRESLITLELQNLKADIVNLKDNHIHTLTEGLKETNKSVNSLSLEVGKLSTIIDERIPRKGV